MSEPDPRPLDFAGLVERLVPKVAELFVTLGSQNPLRMSFADLAGKTVLDVVEVLRARGVAQGAIAASLGMTIGGFRVKLRRLREQYRRDEVIVERTPTLLEQVYAWLDEQTAPGPSGSVENTVSWLDVRGAFEGLPEDALQGVLRFLTESGFIRSTGRGVRKRYRVIRRREQADPGVADASVVLFREGPISVPALAARLGVDESRAAEWVDELFESDELEETEDAEGTLAYRATRYHIPVGAIEGYEAALWDHLAAVIGALCKKIRLGRHRSALADRIGGTTFSFDVPIDHPLEAEIAGYLERTRTQMEEWLGQVRALEESSADAPRRRVTIYAGQMVEDL